MTGLVKAHFHGESMWVQLKRETAPGKWEGVLDNHPVTLPAKCGDLVMVERDADGRWRGSVLAA